MFETEYINPDRARQHQAEFLKGAPQKWLNFYPENLSLVERDGFNDLIELIEKRKGKRCLITDVSLRYQSGSGGSTLSMQVLWHFRKDLRCAKMIDSDLDTKELSKQVLDLFLLSNEKHAKPNTKTVLLLIDTKEKINDLPVKNVLWEDLIEEIHERDIKTKTPAVIILNCIPTDFTIKDTMILPPKLSEEATKQFKEKLLQQIGLQRKSRRKVTSINLLHHKDNGGSGLASEVLRDLREEFTCETLTETIKTDITENKDKEYERKIESTANELHRKYVGQKDPVLLLLNHEEDKPLRYFIKSLLSKLEHTDQTDHPAFIIINAVSKSTVRAPGDVKLKMELLPEEKERFAQKMQEIKKKYKKMSQKFHAFNIMQGGFQKEDAEKLITEEMDAIDAFQAEEKAAKDELANPNTTFNNRALFGFLQVCKDIFKQNDLDFISGLREDVEQKYDFFEWYLAYSKLSFKEEEPDYFRRDVEDCYKRYFTQETQTEEKTLNEKKK
ncbi:hypothetical protein cypCar_00043747 [Cyprinus carpio]|nr:hypothetical protein cypCar_00043747 [Cyprinus carpio]